MYRTCMTCKIMFFTAIFQVSYKSATKCSALTLATLMTNLLVLYSQRFFDLFKAYYKGQMGCWCYT